MTFLRGKIGGFVAFLGVTALVAGGLAWLTREALSMEAERRLAAVTREREKIQQEQEERWHDRQRQIAADRAAKVRQALMLLDSRLTPALAREDSRPYPHYEALHSPFPAVTSEWAVCEPGQVLIPSPLLTADVPPWMLLHFQVDPIKGWTSPQVIPESLQKMLRKQPIELALNNVDEAHKKLLDELRIAYPARAFFATLSANNLDFEPVSKAQQIQQELNFFNSTNPTTPNGPTVSNVNGTPTATSPNTATGNTTITAPQTSNTGVSNISGPLTVNGATQTVNGNGTLTLNNGVPNQADQNTLPADQLGRRFQIITQGKYEGLGSYLNDGRNYSSLQGAFPYKQLEQKLKEISALEKQLSSVEEGKKKELQAKVETLKKEVDDLKRALQPVEIRFTSMLPLWLPSPEQPKHLLMVRPAQIGKVPACQGIVLDWRRLQEILKSTIDDLLPGSRFIPLAKNNAERLDREMVALPIELDAGPLPAPEPLEAVLAPELQPAGWTPLRIGLALVWGAAIVALVTVGLGGWSLLDLSERRIRFVSAVTHELRTPMTTLRLYLDLLNSGMVSEAAQRDEYIRTLGGEADRLHRLIGNVLDFARLEKARPSVDKRPVDVAELLEQLRGLWCERCCASGKDLQVANALPPETNITTDRNLVEQILGNLIDNARKYSQDASDARIWLRAVREGARLVIEVEDRGPGVAKRERGSIFRPFRRGHDAEVKAGGVGLGLALAARWSSLIGARLSVKPGEGGVGACFRLELPA
jgi:signal transduction histidine kinase